ncbi:MAG: alpha/beta fold hydrolase [Candidatus Eremiobacteraeota bacterium]|nr:alpha/beta fold hydrolase [Candidatus Eremiobacteraeota bacterium]
MNDPRTMVMVPGYNEPPDHFKRLEKGRHGIQGIEAAGFSCVTFDAKNDSLRRRIDRFAAFVEKLDRERPDHRMTLLGYSLGGLVVRGYLLAYPERARRISECIAIAPPNWGVMEGSVPHVARALRMSDESIEDMNLNSDFMRWLNGTGGHWVKEGIRPRWELDSEPRLVPAEVRFLTIVGLIPRRHNDNDGLVWADSATLGGRLPADFIRDSHANHMNLIGHFDPIIFALKGFWRNDRIWPQVLRKILDFAR